MASAHQCRDRCDYRGASLLSQSVSTVPPASLHSTSFSHSAPSYTARASTASSSTASASTARSSTSNASAPVASEASFRSHDEIPDPPVWTSSPTQRRWYLVIAGNKIGLWQEWTDMADYVVGVSGAVHKKFNSYAAARKSWVQAYAEGQVARIPR
ncbi:hypothetical protein DENSPDRAFT_852548 [Dentipellis sp. KUC8613]|nr:hypothetical protein DENSPDRAFT_852548 [Dentipellis sp. KUC8613]